MSNDPLRFLHTADWQLGLRARYIPGDAGADVRNARLRTVRRIGELARDRGAEFAVVAGDVFEHHGLKPATVRKTFDVLKEFRLPVYLLPGNHDPYTPDSLYRSELWERNCPENVHVLASPEPVFVRDDAVLLPCPVLERHGFEDPTEHLTAEFGPSGVFRIGVAHGGIREILESIAGDTYESNNDIHMDTCHRATLDYLALGDWHGLFEVDNRTRYPGTPEATKFDEKEPGHVLVVEIGEPGAEPVVTPHRVGGLAWRQLEIEIDDDDDLATALGSIEEIPDKADTLLQLWLRGTVDLGLRNRIAAELVAVAEDRFRWVRTRDEGLVTLVRSEDLEDLDREGWVGEVVQALLDEHGDSATRALRLLYRLHQEVSS